MGLFNQLDERATRQGVYHLLSNYRRLKRIAGEQFEPRVTPTYSFEPRSYTGVVSNPIESHIIRQNEAIVELDYIEKAINSINDAECRHILYLKYCSPCIMSDIEIYVTLEYSETEFYRLLSKAIYWFAESYKNGELMVFIT